MSDRPVRYDNSFDPEKWFISSNKKMRFYGCAVSLIEDNNEERAKAKQYLELWFVFMIKFLELDFPDFHLVMPEDYGMQWIYRPLMQLPSFNALDRDQTMYATYGLKFAIETKQEIPKCPLPLLDLKTTSQDTGNVSATTQLNLHIPKPQENIP